MAELKSQGNIVPTTKLGPVGASIPRALSPTINPLAGAAAAAEENLAATRQLEAADAAAKYEFQIDPVSKLPVLPEDKPSFSIFGAAYNKAIRNNYLLKIKTDVDTELNNIAGRNYLSPSGLANDARAYLDATKKAVHPIASAIVTESGGQRLSALLSGTRSRFARLQIANAKAQKDNFIDESVESLATGTYALNSPELNVQVDNIVDTFLEQNPLFAATQQGGKLAFKNKIHKEYAEIVYSQNAQKIPLEDLNKALIAFQRGKPYRHDGREVFPDYAGMKSADRAEHTAMLNVILRNRSSYRSIDAANSVRTANESLAASLLTDLREKYDSEGDYSALISSGEILYQSTKGVNPEAFVRFYNGLQNYIKANTEQADVVEAARAIAPSLNKIAKIMGIPESQWIDLEDPEIAARVKQLRQVIAVDTNLVSLQAKQDLTKNIVQYSDNQIESLVEEAARAGVRAEFDIKKEYNKRVNNIPGDIINTRAGARFRLSIVSDLIREVNASRRTQKTEADNAAKVRIYADGAIGLNNWESRNQEVQNLLRDWADKPASVQLKLLNSLFSTYRSQDSADAKFQLDAAAIIKNFNFTGSGRAALPILQNEKNAKTADTLFRLSSSFIASHGDGKSDGEIFTSPAALAFVKRTGIIPQGVIDSINTLISSDETIADAVNLYKTYANLPGNLSQNIDRALNKWSTNALQYLLAHGSSPENFMHVRSEAFKLKPDSATVNNSSRIFGEALKPAQLREKTESLARTVIKDQSANQGNWWNKFTEAILYNGFSQSEASNIASYLLPGGEGDKYRAEERARINNVFGVDADKIPRAFMQSAINRFLNNGYATIRNPGDADEMEAAMQTALLNTIREENWGIGQFDVGRARGSGAGNTISRNPIEHYARVQSVPSDPSGLKYLHAALLSHVNSARHVIDAGDQEVIGLQDIRLMPTDKTGTGGIPLYQVFLSTKGGKQNLAVIQMVPDDTGGPDDKAGYLYFDLGLHKQYRNQQIEKEIEIAQREAKVLYGENHQRLHPAGSAAALFKNRPFYTNMFEE